MGPKEIEEPTPDVSEAIRTIAQAPEDVFARSIHALIASAKATQPGRDPARFSDYRETLRITLLHAFDAHAEAYGTATLTDADLPSFFADIDVWVDTLWQRPRPTPKPTDTPTPAQED